MRTDNDQYFYTLEGVAAEAWSLVDGKLSLGEIKSRLISKHQAPAAQFSKDLGRLFGDLAQDNLLQA